ncbi:hypothetical protein D6829_01400 [Candidatus Pacearchaeota archaeon]|nr:MAG: hypothetical protein D6829_01400 [Candidatus Pacearchaeota archaeon]
MKPGKLSLLGVLACCAVPTQPFENLGQIEGVGYVREFYVPDSKHLLVVVRQLHKFPRVVENYISQLDTEEKDKKIRYLRKRYLDVNAAQRDILKILNEFFKRGWIDEVYSEGLGSERSKEYFKKLYSYTMENLFLGESLSEEDRCSYTFVPGATTMLGMQGKKISPAGSLELILESEVEILESLAKNGRIPKISTNNRREDYVLRKICEDKKDIAVVVYGADHDFLDNVINWNLKNPDEKFSLISITPEALAKEDS